MAEIKVENIHKRFDEVKASDDISLDIKHGELMCLLGPSGCGKTTLLRIIAGFITPDKGQVYIDGNDVTDKPPEDRPTAMVFQNYALFPHKSVFENVAFGLKIRKEKLEFIEREVENMLEIVGLSGLGDRSIKQLSGGQQQRVALARALVVNPKILLLDEPLSNLDAKLRIEMRNHLSKIQSELGITSLYVTHDQDEALSLADRLAVMKEGKIVQCGSPEAIYNSPSSVYVADFIGEANLLSGSIISEKDKEIIFELKTGHRLRVVCEAEQNKCEKLLVRPEFINLTIEEPDNEDLNIIPATIKNVNYLGDITYYTVIISGNENSIEMVVPKHGEGEPAWTEEDEVYVSWQISKGILLSSD